MKANMEQATAGTAVAQIQNHQTQQYTDENGASRANFFEQAAEVLCVLAFLPLNDAATVSFSALFERRLRRAYEGGQR